MSSGGIHVAPESFTRWAYRMLIRNHAVSFTKNYDIKTHKAGSILVKPGQVLRMRNVLPRQSAQIFVDMADLATSLNFLKARCTMITSRIVSWARRHMISHQPPGHVVQTS